MIHFELLHPKMTMEYLGLLPTFLSERDLRPAAKQINSAYAHGGGWRSFPGFTMAGDGTLTYPPDPPLRPLAKALLRGEIIYFYLHAWVAVRQRDGSFDVARID